MNRIIITEEQTSNKPVEIITLKSDQSLINFWIDKLIQNPGKYSVELSHKFNFSEECSTVFECLYNTMLKAYSNEVGPLNNEQLLVMLCGILNGFSFQEERHNNEYGDIGKSS